MEKHFPEVKVIKLEQNYRSTNTILNAANAIIKHNVRRRGKKLWSQKGDGPKITLHTFANDEEEARTIVEQIEYARLAQRVPWADQAILFRTNAQSRPLETALRQAGVRYHLIGGQSFFDRREVRDFLAYLKVLVNPQRRRQPAAHRQRAGARAERRDHGAPAGRQPRTQMLGVRRHEEPGGDDDLPGQDPREHRGLRRIHRAHARTPARPRASRATRAPCRRSADRFLEEIGYFTELRRSEKNPETAENRVRNLKDLIATLDGADAAVAAAVRPPPDLPGTDHPG